jgi:hypothetical protein
MALSKDPLSYAIGREDDEGPVRVYYNDEYVGEGTRQCGVPRYERPKLRRITYDIHHAWCLFPRLYQVKYKYAADKVLDYPENQTPKHEVRYPEHWPRYFGTVLSTIC